MIGRTAITGTLASLEKPSSPLPGEVQRSPPIARGEALRQWAERHLAQARRKLRDRGSGVGAERLEVLHIQPTGALPSLDVVLCHGSVGVGEGEREYSRSG